MRCIGTALSVSVCALGFGCSFENSATAPGFDASGEEVPGEDGGRPDGGGNPADCPEPIHLEFSVDGVSEAAAGEPFVHALVGDTIALSAQGSCSQRGGLSFQWTLEPITTGISANVEPGPSAPALTVFAHRPGDYIVTLVIADGQESRRESFFGFSVHGFRQLEAMPEGAGDIRDLDADSSWLWVATTNGAYRLDLTDPSLPATPVEDFASGDSLPAKLASVHVDAAGAVWFGGEDAESDIWRLTGTTIESLTFPETARTRDISDAEGGVRVATDKAVFRYMGGDGLMVELNESLRAVADLAAVGYGGDDKLYELEGGGTTDIFGGNNKIRALESADDFLLVGSESKGFALVDSALSVQATFDADSGLAHSRVHAIDDDGAGDYWLATERGVARYKQDRGIALSVEDGLESDPVRAIAADREPGRRAYYAGVATELWVLSIPPGMP